MIPRDVYKRQSQDSRPNGGYCPAAKSRFGRFLALTVPSAVGLVTHVPLRLYPDEKSSLQRTATQRHRTQLYEILGSFELFFRKVTYFAKKRGTPCAARHSRFMLEKSRKLELVVDTEKRLVYTVIRLKLESFRKVCYFAKIFVPFFGCLLYTSRLQRVVIRVVEDDGVSVLQVFGRYAHFGMGAIDGVHPAGVFAVIKFSKAVDRRNVNSVILILVTCVNTHAVLREYTLQDIPYRFRCVRFHIGFAGPSR